MGKPRAAKRRARRARRRLQRARAAAGTGYCEQCDKLVWVITTENYRHPIFGKSRKYRDGHGKLTKQ